MDWEAFASLEPLGDLRGDWHAAQITAMMFNLAVDKKDRKQIQDFVLQWTGEPKKPQTVEQKIAIARAMAQAAAAIHRKK